jgi:hypothetical protein
MVIKAFYETRPDGVNLYRTYSNEGFYIIQNETGAEYEEAIDVEGSMHTYSETDKPIEDDDIPTDPDTTTYAELAQIYREGVNSLE